MLGALGMKLIAVVDEEAVARFASRVPVRNEACTHYNDVITLRLTRRHMQKLGQNGAQVRWAAARKMHAAAVKGGTNSRKNMTRRQASELARKAAIARWAKAALRKAA
jgi:hypothetical protein